MPTFRKSDAIVPIGPMTVGHMVNSRDLSKSTGPEAVCTIAKRATCHTFRHCFAAHYLGHGFDIPTVQESVAQKDTKTTVIHIHVLNRGGKGVRSTVGTF